MNNETIDIIAKAYKPYKITKKNKCIVLYTMDGNLCMKENTSINYHDLYNYLKTRNFTSIPDIIEDTRKNTVLFKYYEDLEVDKSQKAKDLIKTVAELHKKTAYTREIKQDKYNEISEKLINQTKFIKEYYTTLFDTIIKKELYTPYEYLFLKNYELIDRACNYCISKINEWTNLTKNNNNERICLIHNNLELDHYIKNEKEYLISWDNYTFDTPIIDLYKLYQKEWKELPFNDIFNEYNKIFELTKEERLLLDILISIPYKIEKQPEEINKCREYNKLISYLTKSSKTVIAN